MPTRRSFSAPGPPVLKDPIKLIEIGPVTEEKKNNLLLLQAGTETNDYRRKLIVTHWDGSRFVTDTTNEFLGTALDALLVGHFRPTLKPTVARAASQTTVQNPLPRRTITAWSQSRSKEDF